MIERLEQAFCTLRELGDAEVIHTDDWVQLTTPSAPTHFRNGIFRSVLTSEETPQRIEEMKAHYAKLGVPFAWRVTPMTEPINMVEYLVDAGFESVEVLEQLAARPSKFPEATERVDHIGQDRIEEWLAATTEGWGMVPAATERFRMELEHELTKAERVEHYFIGYADGQPAGACALRIHGDFAAFTGASVAPAMRNRGVYRQMIYSRMQFLRDRNIDLVTNSCVSTTSAPICKKLGFKKVCEFTVYVYPPPA